MSESNQHESIGIIIPVFNGERFIERALKSVYSQKLPVDFSLKIIVIDDKSEDCSVALILGLIEKFGLTNIDLIKRTANGGRAAARNIGIDIAVNSRLDWITFLDQDDWLPENSLFERLKWRGHAAWINGLQKFHLEVSSKPSWLRKEWLDQPQNGGVLGASLFPIRIFSWVGKFNEDLTNGGDDIDWFARFRKIGFSEKKLPVVVLNRGIHESNGSSNPNSSKDLLRMVRNSFSIDNKGSAVRIGVVMSIYNHSEFLVKALKSIQDQTYMPIEIIIIDDGSQPPITSEALKSINLPIQLHRLNKNMGQSYAKNYGVKKLSKCVDWIAFIDADDEWPKDRLLALSCELKDSKYDAVFGFMQFIDRSSNFINTELRQNRMLTSGLINKKIFEKENGFDVDIKFGDGIDLISRLMKSRSCFSHIQLITLLRRIHDNNMTASVSSDEISYKKVVRAHIQRMRGANP